MKLFFQYLNSKKYILLAEVFFCLIFLISFSLYHLPIIAIIYPIGLCLLFGIIILFFDFLKIRKKHELMTNIHSLTDVITQTLPDSNNIIEEDYREIIHLISEEHNQYRTSANTQYDDMIQYYTVWVHQIKTPIASMRLHLQNEDSSFSRQLSTDLFRIEQYVEMVLMFLRLNSDSTDYVIQEYDLDSIVKQAVKKYAGEFITRKLNLIYEPLNTTVITDEKWLSFIIEQVLSNALKYTPSGNISITLQPDKQLCISDTGIGISAEDLPRIFENGYTGYNGRSQKKASGIGLFLCKRICNNLGHTIHAESIVDKGTTIRIDLMQTKRTFD